MDQIVLYARAKINLALDVVGKRPDGYHELRSVMQTLTLADTVLIKKVRKERYLKLVTNIGYLPTDSRNLAYKAAKLMIDTFGINEGVFINLEKRVPVSAGLGGGSADCAAVLAGMRGLFGLKIPAARMRALGLSLGADVPFCLARGTQLAEGVGERLSRLRPIPDAWILLAKPPFSISTAEVFRAFDASKAQRPDIERLLHYIASADLRGICRHMSNALESVTAAAHPVINQLKETMLEHSALSAIMSGSGPTVFGVFEKRDAAEAAGTKIRIKFPEINDIFIVKSFNV